MLNYMAKQRKKTTKRKSSKVNLKLINIILLLIILIMFIFIYILLGMDSKEYQKVRKEPIKIVEKVETKIKDEFDEYIEEIKVKKEEITKYSEELYEKPIKKIEKNLEIEKSLKKEPKEKIQKNLKKEVDPSLKKVPFKENQKAKLAIIFDDVTTQRQINKINNIGYKTTISLMPPTKAHPNSAKIARKLSFYMIHFPLEAKYFKGEEENTLYIKDSYEKIEKRVSQIRKWYPNAKYTNNHTGSKFTSNKESMDKLFKALNKYDFIFMDSKTTSKTVGKQMAQKYNMPYIVRDIFLDNEHNFKYIQNQLKKAIKISKKRGYAIAICHPHSITIDTLRQSKYLLKDLDLVYLNELPILK